MDLFEYVDSPEAKSYPINMQLIGVLGINRRETAISFGRFLITRGYKSFISKTGVGSLDILRGEFGASITTQDLVKKVKLYQETPGVKLFYASMEKERMANKNSSFQDILNSIKRKNDKELSKSISKNNYNEAAQSFIISEITSKLREPPIYSEVTKIGNKTYIFIKKALGEQVAKAAAMCVKEAFREEVNSEKM